MQFSRILTLNGPHSTFPPGYFCFVTSKYKWKLYQIVHIFYLFLNLPQKVISRRFTSAPQIFFSLWIFPGLSLLTFLSSLSTQLAVTAECKNIVVSNLHCCCSCSCWPACQGEMGYFPLPFTCICLLSLSLSLSLCF